jgi:hypothetical protein
MGEEKKRSGIELAADAGKDYLSDKALEFAPQVSFQALAKLEQARRFLQQGSVPGASKALAASKVAAKSGGTLLKKVSNPSIQAVIELAKGAYLIGDEKARDGHAEAGEKLIQEPLAYQAANLLVSPADALSKYGAAKELADKEAFEKKYMLAPNDPMRVAFENTAVERLKAENQQKHLDEARRALDPDLDLEERTMDLVRSITRPLPNYPPPP